MPTTTQGATHSATNATSAVPIANKGQIATCTKVSSFNTSNGKKRVGTFKIEGISLTFEVWENRYFIPVEGEKYCPVIDVIPSAYKNKAGEAKPTNKPIVNWEKVGG